MKLDAYEKDLLQLDDDGPISVQSSDPNEKEALIAAARETLQKAKPINIRMSCRGLLFLLSPCKSRMQSQSIPVRKNSHTSLLQLQSTPSNLAIYALL